MESVLEMHGISKRFTGVQALSAVDLQLRAGEIHSIIGQNGAGKSTLMKILSGNYIADEGRIFMHGKEVRITSPADSAKLGIGIVYQELSLLNNLTVAENIFLGREVVHGVRLNNRKMSELARKYLRDLGIDSIDVDQNIEVFPLAKQQLIEIAKAISVRPSILILDEPTAALTNKDTERLFQILFKLKSQGICIVFISHRLEEIKKYCDCGTIMMNGRITANVRMDEVDELQIIEHMLGDTFNSFHRVARSGAKRESPVLSLRDISLRNEVDHVSCDIYPGEISGFTGLLGAGQDTLWRIVYGARRMDSGTILVRGQKASIRKPAHAVKLGIGLLTENRKEEGLFPEMSNRDNIALPSLGRFRLARFFPLLRYGRITGESQKLTGKLAIKMRSPKAKVKFLSGGNQQKIIVSRWLLKNLDVLVFIEPTRGVDVGAKTEIYRILTGLAELGKAIVVISTDTTEILQLADRIIVMVDGQISGALEGAADDETLIRLIQGKPEKKVTA
ncbi:MAG: sugar ABC transporter ATP-binding protein [Clostridia bacterium]|nr:sugar ABC transporter ATP-binding protein [Clostridia bacterium]